MLNKTSVIAESLFDSGAIKFGKFTLKSGKISPYYIDLTYLFSSPICLRRVVNIVAKEILRLCSENKIDKVASIELKGALLLAAASYQICIPCIIVRKKSKNYGLLGRITGGEINPGDHILFFDDLITDGQSKVEGIKPLEEMGAKVNRILVVIDREQGGKENLSRIGYILESITTISDIVTCLLMKRKISETKANTILNYIKSEGK